MPEYRIYEGSLQERFFNSRSKGRIYGGGYGNGKTSAACILAIQVAMDYPGAQILIARGNYPKLMDTIYKEFHKWLPKNMIANKTMSPQPQTELTNGSVIMFRNLTQRSTNENGESTSNVLSMTLDLVIVDQIEDPEIGYKDIIDLVGRLRGTAPYHGNDPTMPPSGPRWMVLTTNPTRNWVYHRLVKPIHEFNRTGKIPDDLPVEAETGKPIFELFEGSTYDNKDNLPADFLTMMSAMYVGQMKERYLLGEWAGYEGLVYPGFNADVHLVEPRLIYDFVQRPLIRNEAGMKAKITYLEGFDYGKSSPSCHLLGYYVRGVLVVVGGWYKPQGADSMYTIGHRMLEHKTAARIARQNQIHCDPDIFRRNKQASGDSIAEMLRREVSLNLVKGENNISSGISKIQGMWEFNDYLWNPITETYGSPRLLINEELDFFTNEITSYYWDRDKQTGDYKDKPIDRNDHAMDTLKYMVTPVEPLHELLNSSLPNSNAVLTWQEFELANANRNPRYG